MGDLISRSALIEEIQSLSVHITGLRSGKGVLANFMNEYRKSVLRIIDEQPTAYDVEKVVAELEQVKNEGVDCNNCPYVCDSDGCEHRAIDQATDIVKRGGVE